MDIKTFKQAIEYLKPIADNTPLDGYGKALKMAIQALAEMDNGKNYVEDYGEDYVNEKNPDSWNDVTDNLPQDYSRVIVSDAYGNIDIARYSKKQGKWYISSINREIEVMAWKPLPMPYGANEVRIK